MFMNYKAMSCQVPEVAGEVFCLRVFHLLQISVVSLYSLSLDLCVGWKLVIFLQFYIVTSQALCV